MISKELLDILACPLCKTDVRLEDDRIVQYKMWPKISGKR